MEEMKQQIKAKRGKLNVYNNQIHQHQQKRTFRNNDGMFYKKLNGGSNNENTNSILDKDKNKEFQKKYGVLIKFIIRMLNGFQTSNLNSQTLTKKKI